MGLGEFRHGEEVVPEVDRLDAGIEVEEGLAEGGPRYQDVILAGEVDPVGVTFPDVVFVIAVFHLDLIAEAQVGRVDAATPVGVVTEDEAAVGDEFEALWVRRRQGLDEEGPPLLPLTG